MTQQQLFSTQTAVRRTPWFAHALGAVMRLAYHVDFTTDDVWAEIPTGYGTPDNRAMGAVMREASRRGWCKATDRTRTSKRKSCNRRPVRVWSGLMS